MTMPNIDKNKLLIIGLVVVAVVGYYLFATGGDEAPAVITTETGGSQTIGQDLVIELNRLRALQNIGDGFFKDPVFNSLEDRTQTVVPQPLGRTNPFAPL